MSVLLHPPGTTYDELEETSQKKTVEAKFPGEKKASIPIGSSRMVYMLTWLGYTDGKWQIIYGIHTDPSWDLNSWYSHCGWHHTWKCSCSELSGNITNITMVWPGLYSNFCGLTTLLQPFVTSTGPPKKNDRTDACDATQVAYKAAPLSWCMALTNAEYKFYIYI